MPTLHPLARSVLVALSYAPRRMRDLAGEQCVTPRRLGQYAAALSKHGFAIADAGSLVWTITERGRVTLEQIRQDG